MRYPARQPLREVSRAAPHLERAACRGKWSQEVMEQRALGHIRPPPAPGRVPRLVPGRAALEGLPANGRFDHVAKGHAFDTVTTITTWPSAAVWTNACSSARNTAGASPVTVVLIGPMAGSRPAAVSASRTAKIAGVSRS